MLEIKILLTKADFFIMVAPAVHSNHGQHIHIDIDGWMLTENTRNCLIAARCPARAHTTYLSPHYSLELETNLREVCSSTIANAEVTRDGQIG